MNNNDMTGLLNLAYEIEGLIMLRISRGEETAPEMRQLLVDKAARLLEELKNEAAQPVAVAPQAAAATEEKFEATTPEVAPVPVAESDMTADEQAIAASAVAEETEDAAGDAAAERETEAPAPATINDTLVAETPLTLDERLARERAADISKAFTLNDRFRFRRELFRNSDEEFKETLEVIGSMSGMDEAEDYFFNDLCWDPDKEEVKEFMAIVAKHF